MTNRIILTILTIFGMSNMLNAQDSELILATGKDASQYLKSYAAPAINGLMYDLSDGWYSTGKTHKLFGFDLSISVSAAKVPESAKTFMFNPADYSELKLQSGGSAMLPTVAGGNTSEKLVYAWNGEEGIFDVPNGAAESWPDQLPIELSVPSAMLQVGVGLPLKTDLKLRFFPKTSNDDITYSLIGAGIQHDISQYLGFIKTKALTVSGLAAFTSAKVSYFPTDFSTDVNSEMALSINSYVFQLLGDINLKIINLFVGIGYVGGTTNFDVLGSYELDYNLNGKTEADERIKDPVSIGFNVSGMKTTAGVRLNLGPIKFFGTYSLQEYSSFSTGIVVSIR